MRERPVRIGCDGLFLEGALSLPVAAGPAPGVAVCHPHPLHGGDMGNPVVVSVARALAVRGLAVLRFNFRGTSGSEGTHGGGEAEVADVLAVLDFLAGQDGVDAGRLAVAGYSFGAAVGLRAGCRDPRVRALALVAPPLTAFPMAEARDCPVPKLAVAGTRDAYCPAPLFEAWFAAAAEPKRHAFLAGADHFFSGREGEVGAVAAIFLATALAPGVP